MNTVLQIFLLFAIGIYFLGIFYLLKKQSLSLKYTLVWLVSGVLMLLVVLFPDVVQWIINRMGIIELTNGIFAVVIFCLLLISMTLTGIVSKMNKRNRAVVQQCALMEKRIRDLEEGYKK